MTKEPFIFLLAEDKEHDCYLFKRALKSVAESGQDQNHQLLWVKDGQELLDYLDQSLKAEPNSQKPFPHLILLDLNMPKIDGREALIKIRQNQNLNHLPVIIFSTSNSKDDLMYCFKNGANAYVEKPDEFDQIKHTFKALVDFWVQCSLLPQKI